MESFLKIVVDALNSKVSFLKLSNILTPMDRVLMTCLTENVKSVQYLITRSTSQVKISNLNKLQVPSVTIAKGTHNVATKEKGLVWGKR